MGERLGELLIRSGACAPEAVRDALESQVIFGGRLGTNLLELGRVTEADLAAALGRQHRLPALHGEVRLDPAVLRLLRPEQADRWEVVPLLLAGRRLALLTATPTDLRVLDEVAFATGMRLEPVVAAEARIWALLRSAYGLDRVARGLGAAADAARRQRTSAPADGAPGPERLGPDLMDQAAFEALYAHAAPPAPPAPGAWGSPPQDGAGGLAPASRPLEPEAPAPDEAAPEDPEPWPLRFDEAIRMLHGVHERAAIARTVLRYARSRFRRAVLLTVHRDEARGWAGVGERLGRAEVELIRVPLGTPGIVDTVVRTRAHLLGPIPRTEANALLLERLGGAPANALLVPILARGRVVNVLYADGGAGRLVDASGAGELLILATRIAQSYDALLARVQLG